MRADQSDLGFYLASCPACNGGHVKKVGVQSGHQRYQCRACNKKFRLGIEPGKRVPAEQVGMAIRLFYSGTSYKQIAEAMADAYDIPEPSKATIYEWVRDYTNKGVAKMNEHKPTVGDSWVADEMQVDVGGEEMWNWNVMDEETRYNLGDASIAGAGRSTGAGRHAQGVGSICQPSQDHQDRQAAVLQRSTKG